MPRKRNLFDPNSAEPYKLSRSRLEVYLKCPRCFYLDRRLGIDRPSGPPFTINSAVDTLRLAQTTLADAISSLVAWCGHHNLIEASASALSSAVRLEFPSLQRHREHGPDACLDWPGSRSERRAVHARP